MRLFAVELRHGPHEAAWVDRDPAGLDPATRNGTFRWPMLLMLASCATRRGNRRRVCQPVSPGDPKPCLSLEIRDGDLLKSCQFVPFSAIHGERFMNAMPEGSARSRKTELALAIARGMSVNAGSSLDGALPTGNGRMGLRPDVPSVARDGTPPKMALPRQFPGAEAAWCWAWFKRRFPLRVAGVDARGVFLSSFAPRKQGLSRSERRLCSDPAHVTRETRNLNHAQNVTRD